MSDTRRLSETFVARLSAEQRASLELTAAERGCSASELVRRLIDRECRESAVLDRLEETLIATERAVEILSRGAAEKAGERATMRAADDAEFAAAVASLDRPEDEELH